MALMFSKGMPVGTLAPDFKLKGVDGAEWSLANFDGASALVVIFTCNHCPYAVAAETRLVALQAEFAERGVRFVAINPNDPERYPDDDFAGMQRRAAERGFNFPYLQDLSQEVARAYDAVCTPDLFLFDASRRLVYNGRIDDNWQTPEAVTREDLRAALEAVLAERPLDFEVQPSMGCSIKWRA